MVVPSLEPFVKKDVQARASQKITGAQQEVWERGLLTSGFSCLLQMPTGSGKTYLAEQAMRQTIASGKRAVYLTPLRALADELFMRWRDAFAPHSVGVFTGDYASGDYPVSFEDAELLILTPEKFDACLRNWRAHWNWLPQLELLVVDEFHLLGEKQRGARLEGALLRLVRLNPFARILGLSATLGNVHELASWLGGVAYRSDERPVPLEWRNVYYRKADEKPELLLQEIEGNLEGKTLVFVQSRRRAETLQVFLTERGIKAKHHHAGLSYKERHEVEQVFRHEDVRVLVATATLEMGLNLPVRQVILYDLQGFNGSEFVPLSVNSVWQRAGRAGRPGLDEQGEVVLLTPVWERDTGDYSKGEFETIQSALSCERMLAEQIVVEIASGLSRTRGQLETTFQFSLARRQKRLADVRGVLDTMLKAGMLLEVEGEKALQLKVTPLGRIAVRHHLLPETVIKLRSVLQTHPQLTFFDVLLLAASTEDCQPLLVVDFEELTTLTKLLQLEPSTFLALSQKALRDCLGIGGKRLLAALNTALVLRTWTRLGNARAVAADRGCYPFEVLHLQDATVRLLQAMVEISKLIAEFQEKPYELETLSQLEKIQTLLTMAQGGLDERAVTLTHLPGLGHTLAKRLKEIGIAHLEELCFAHVDDVASIQGISKKRAKPWITQAEILVKRIAGNRYDEQPTRGESKVTYWPIEIDPYRLRRALELNVQQGGRVFRVSGGLEPHTVRWLARGLTCDCKDNTKGSVCKHILAVHIKQKNTTVLNLVQQLTQECHESLDLMNLWLQGSEG